MGGIDKQNSDDLHQTKTSQFNSVNVPSASSKRSNKLQNLSGNGSSSQRRKTNSQSGQKGQTFTN